MLEQEQPTKAIPIIQAVIETVVPAMGQADDSNGELGSCIGVAFEYLDRAIEMMTPDERQSMFDYCVTEAPDERYLGWDWGWDLAEVAAGLLITAEQRTTLFSTLDRMAAGRRKHREESWTHMYPRPTPSDFPDYDLEHAEAIKLQVIGRLDGPEAAKEFLKSRINIPRFRQSLVQLYIEQGNLGEARRLCNEYLDTSNPRLPGIQLWFQVLLLEIARKGNDTAECCEYCPQPALLTPAHQVRRSSMLVPFASAMRISPCK